MADRDRNKKVLLDLAKQPNNNRCADCGAPEPDWASYKLGIFVCLNCSGTHRNLPAISRIKSIRLDYWDDDVVEVLLAYGAIFLLLGVPLLDLGSFQRIAPEIKMLVLSGIILDTLLGCAFG